MGQAIPTLNFSKMLATSPKCAIMSADRKQSKLKGLTVTTLSAIANRIADTGGHALLVGGSVRDKMLGAKSKDLDVEVHGMAAEKLTDVLAEFGHVNPVGASFGVLKLTVGDDDFDFSLPRRENKVGRGHKGFQVEVDPTMTVEEAARRRDFTFNSMALDVLTGDVVDPFGGVADLEDHTLRMTDARTFVEDPLRVLRGFQFCGRFDLEVEPETARVCAEMVGEFDALAVERVWEEWHKWATKSTKLSKGLRFLREVEWLDLFPEVAALVGVEQSTEHHPEGDVFEHTCQVVDECARLADQHELGQEQRTVLVFAGLCHDFGKVTTTRTTDENVTSHGHDKAAGPFVKMFLDRIGAPKWLVEQVVPLCANHMFRADPTPRNVRRLANRVAPSNVEMLVHLMRADRVRKQSAGQARCSRCHRPLTDPNSVARGVGPVCAAKGWPGHCNAVLELSKALDCSEQAPKPVLMGRHLMPFMPPGPEMGRVLRAAFDAQLDGVFETVDDGVAWVQSHI